MKNNGMLWKIIGFFLIFGIIIGLNSPVYPANIPFQLPNVFDPGQVQKNIEKENLTHRTKALAPVQNEAQPHAPIPGAEKIKFKLNRVIITGNTVFTDEELQAIFSSSLHKTISIADLQTLVQKITTLYRERGFILSRGLLPPQEIKNGTVKVEVVEGFISTVTVTGTPGGARKLIEEYGQHILQSKPLNLNVMQREILLANDLPGISVKAVIIPSKTVPDSADLTLVADNKVITGGISQDNYGTRYLGPIQSSLLLAANSIFVGGDTTSATITVTANEKELQYYNLSHTEPLNSKGLNLTVGTSYTATQPQFLLEPVEIVGLSASFYANLTYAMIRSRERNLSLHAYANYQNVTSTILATPLYQDRIRSLTLGATYDTSDRWSGSDNFALDVIHGFPILGAKMHSEQSRPDGRAEYTRVTGSFSRLQPIHNQISVYTSFNGQYSFQPLLAAEQYSVGGPIYGRGYGPSEIVGDEGLAGKIELRLDAQPEKYFLQSVEYYIFYDVGVAWNLDTVNTPQRQDLTSTGAGMRLYFSPHVYGELFVAKPLSRQSTTLTPLSQNPQQARGFFQIVARL